MHEMSLTEGVIRILEDQAATHDFTRVKTVWLEIGELSSVDPESMLFCFDAVARGSAVAAGAKLEIVRVAGRAFCLDCAEAVALGHRGDPCPRCGGWSLQVTAGEEMRVKELEVE
ncbi:hydrogenase maturation nickel metallochaperone HypA [Magnetospirillum sp. UT-4]|uniref:hydrogenase maturation nickel metallochaperone HypA n=1 Tax=Magnetospirillum sp. UT-4 TaxID=2681467 RepID=UPI00137E5715|nr:hydrogenase maturation nickel metallochaperone HypA [Magnetospirillum sp. UT-4]CAA7614299.1 protein involved with the maturation of hydrogenases 1 and 2 [Magnetospirillum sp. UT-4]